MRRTLSVAAAAALALTFAGASSPATAAKTFTACVKKSTGDVRMISGKTKCQKGWKKYTWTKKGPRGNKGPQGSQGGPGPANSFPRVLDATGAPVGEYRSYYLLGPALGVYAVLIDGGIYQYLENGQVVPFASPYWATNTCTGDPFVVIGDPEQRQNLLIDPQLRVVYRASMPVWGVARAFKLVASYEPVVNQQAWSLNSSGICSNAGLKNGDKIPVIEVSAPQDRPGPLKLG